jgi:hypothetical protein
MAASQSDRSMPEFLRQRAAEMREISGEAPTIAAALRKLATELEAEAARLEGHDPD